MEIDPDKPAQPTPPPEQPTAPEVPPPQKGEWGVGGKDQEGKFAPQGKTGAKPAGPEEPPIDLGPAGFVGVDLVIGLGGIRVPTNDTNPTDATVFSWLFDAHYRIGDIFTLGLRVPFATGSVKGPGGSADDFNSFAFGNLELSVRAGIPLTPSRRVRLPVGVAFALPTAAGDLFAKPEERGMIAQAEVNQAAGAARGFEEQALFASKRMGIVPSAGILYEGAALRLGFSTKLEIMGKTGGEDLPPPAADGSSEGLHDPNINWVTGAQGSYAFLGGKLEPGLRMWLAVYKEPVFHKAASGATTDYSGPQFVLEPNVMTTIPFTPKGAPALKGGVGYIAPIGDAPGRKTSMKGVRLSLAFLF
jgi:hypothetical protein